MTISNNDILKRLRFTFDFSDSKMISIFDLVGHQVTRAQVCDWLKNELDADHQSCDDVTLATFLNGLIVERRGRKDGPQPSPERQLSNNMIFKKLKIALDLKSDAVLEILNSADIKLSTHELNAFFRNPNHKHYRECKDQVLRKFLQGVQRRYHDNA